jgi:hypothetical protein
MVAMRVESSGDHAAASEDLVSGLGGEHGLDAGRHGGFHPRVPLRVTPSPASGS